MQFSFTFIHMATSEALQDYAQQKISEKLQKFATKPLSAKVSFTVDRHEQTAHCAIAGGDGFDIQVEHSCGDMYGSIDHMVDKLEGQLKKQKEKIKHHKQKRDKLRLAYVAAEAASPAEEDDSLDAADLLRYEESRRRLHG